MKDKTNDLMKKNTENVPNIEETIAIGAVVSADGFRKMFYKRGMTIDGYAQEILDKIPLTKERKEIKIIIISLANLGFGFNENVEYPTICLKAKEMGLKLCPAEVGPQVCLQIFKGFQEGDWFGVASEPIIVDGISRLFSPKWSDKKLSLSSHFIGPGVTYSAHHRFAFIKPT